MYSKFAIVHMSAFAPFISSSRKLRPKSSARWIF